MPKLATNIQEFICIYCKKRHPEVKPTTSHIIPTFLGGFIELDYAVCKTCNGKINSEVEQPLRNNFSYLRSGLNLEGRRKREIKIIGEATILGQKIKIGMDKIEIPPFEHKNTDGKNVLVIVGDNDYIEKKKKEIESNSSKKWRWNEFEEPPYPEILVEVFPFDKLKREKGQRLSAKIVFERLCQIKTPSILIDKCYDKIREFIKDGKDDSIYANLFYDSKIMERNFNIPFPYHAIFLMQRNKTLVGIVTLFGLFYFLVIITTHMPIITNWEECIWIHPQFKKEIVPIIRGSLCPTIPSSAFTINNETYERAIHYADEKFKKALKTYGVIMNIGRK